MTRAARHPAYSGLRKRKSGRSIGVALSSAVLAASLLTACSGSENKGPEATLDPKDPSTSASSTDNATPSPSQTDPHAGDKAAALDAYGRMWAEQAKAYAKGSTSGTEFDTYAVALAKTSITNDLADLRSKGIVTKGAPTHSAKITEFKPRGTKAASAKVKDCLDTTHWKYLYAKTGKPVPMPSTRLPRYYMTAQAEVWGKSWKIIEIKLSQDPC
ncbi:hypothetical protein V2W30_41130 (plasmid) [Streptomyces sp. Q6]|uniref:Uncharacterized protein n=1 Tax=Streptomyces citrinus TaxID=3118173 RepID=A0ACD5AR83_9ACTN